MTKVIDQVDAACEIVEVLQRAGHEAVLAGGCVRDLLLGVHPKDYDIATSATPDQVEALFPKTVAVGKSFGVIRVIDDDGEQFEVATFREDSEDSDGRRPNNVKFSSMEADARRRDLTINAMFLDPIQDKIYDFVGGQADLKARKIRFVGDPQKRIDEDKLRLLRVVRFASRGGWHIDKATKLAVEQNAAKIRSVSPERIGDELNKIFGCEHAAEGYTQLITSGLWSWSGLCVCNNGRTYPTLLAIRNSLQENPHLAWAVILMDYPVTAKDTLAALRFSNDFINKVTNLIHTYADAVNAKKLTAVARSRLLANADFLNIVRLVEFSGNHDAAKYLLQVKVSTPLNQIHPDKLVDGSDLIALGVKPGKVFKSYLASIEKQQREGTITTREQALDTLRLEVQLHTADEFAATGRNDSLSTAK